MKQREGFFAISPKWVARQQNPTRFAPSRELIPLLRPRTIRRAIDCPPKACASSWIPSSSATGWKARRTFPTPTSARSPSNSASNMPRGSRSCFAARRRRRCSTSSGSTPKPASPSRARPSALLVGVLPALDLRQAARPRQCELDGAVHACCRTATASAPGSSCICPISPPTDRPSRTISTSALLEQCVARPEDVSHFFWKADTFGIKVRGSASIRNFLATPARAARHPPLQPHPHEPRPQRLSGEPLLQPGRCNARRLTGSPHAVTCTAIAGRLVPAGLSAGHRSSSSNRCRPASVLVERNHHDPTALAMRNQSHDR